MASFVVKNNAESTVADNPLAVSATTLNVGSGEGTNFPSTFPFLITIWDETAYSDPGNDSGMEIVRCTARSTDALTIVRAQEGTSDVAHAQGEAVAMLWTAGIFNDATYGIATKIDTIDTGADVTGDNAPQTHAMSTHTDEGALATLNTVGSTQIDNDAVTYGKIQNVVNDERILGRVSGADGVIEELTKAQVLSMLNVTDGANVNVTTNLSEGTSTETTVDVDSSDGNNATLVAASTSRAGVLTKAKFDEIAANNAKNTNATHTGDVSGEGELTIASDVVTYDKMQDASATDKLLGRSTAGAGTIEEISCTAAGRAILDDATAVAQVTTLGLGNAKTVNIFLPAESAYLPATNPASLDEELGSTIYAGHSHLAYDDTTAESAVWRCPMPDYNGGNITVKAYSKVAATPSGSVTLQYDILTIGLASGEAFDTASTSDTSVNISHSLDTGSLLTDIMIASATIDPANVAANDLMVIEIKRDVADTLSGDGELVGIMIEYTRT